MVIDLEDKKISLDSFGSADTLDGVDAEKQILRNSLLIYFGSWFDNLDIGPDWFRILEKQFTINEIKSDIRRVLNALDIVESILNVSLGNVGADRGVELTFVVTTTTGNTITFSEAI